jgi:asparagine synthase (glutamine-hydrolysing)
MCGIAGIVALNRGTTLRREDVDAACRTMIHRGPDDQGIAVFEQAILGMRRLSIIDLSGGHQPIANEDESLHVVCNGEIYNFRELRRDLIGRGHRFRSGSDAEVVLHLYEEYGDACVERLEGMFGFALWDENKRRLLIARDRLGIKPLYFYSDGQRMLFASEIKALLATPWVRARLDTSALPEYLRLGYVPGSATLFAGVRRLLPGHSLVVSAGEISISRYWRLPDQKPSTEGPDELARELWARLEKAVVRQMVSDVPIGAFLSGGLDSSSIVAALARNSAAPIKTYSIGYEGGPAERLYNELPYARQVAEVFGTEHREIVVRPDVVGLLPELIWHLDEPLSDSAMITTYLVARFAAQDVKVILSGVGGDELFGGYTRYLGDHYAGYYRKLPRFLRRGVLQPLARRLPSDRHSRFSAFGRQVRALVESGELEFEQRYQTYVQAAAPAEVAALLGTAACAAPPSYLDGLFAEARGGDRMWRLMAVDLRSQLADDLLLLSDKITMAPSLECRVPLLDEDLVEFAAHIPGDVKVRRGELKWLMKRALAPVLPCEILDRPKRGFGAPVGAWIKEQLAPVIDWLLAPASIARRGLLHGEAVARTLAAHRSQRADMTDLLWSLVTLEIWSRMFLDGQSPADLATELSEIAGRTQGRVAS